MEKNNQDSEEKTPEFEETTSIAKIEDMNLDETQFTERLYYSAGLDPIIEAGMKDYEKRIQTENKMINKVFGIRESDIRGYSESVAKRVTFAIYKLLNEQYGGKVGNLRSYILSLEDERDRANMRYDELMGRVIGILGDEYKELRTDSKEFMEKITNILGEDLAASKIDQTALAEKLADIDGLRVQVNNLQNEKQQMKEKYELKLNNLKSQHKEEIIKLDAEMAQLRSQISNLESEKVSVSNELDQLKNGYNELNNSIKAKADTIPREEIGKKMSDDLYKYILEDSKVPKMVIDGVGKFIDFRKYLAEAVERGIKESCNRFEQLLETSTQDDS